MLFKSAILFIFLCISVYCFSNPLPENNKHKLLVLELTHIDAHTAKSLCGDIIASTNEFLSISISVDAYANSLIISGLAYEVESLVKHIDDSVELK